METYEAWADELGLTLATTEGILSQRGARLLGPKSRLLYRFEAASWEEANAIHHLRQGWEPYKPMGEAAQCPDCDANFYPKGSGQCWRCDYEC